MATISIRNLPSETYDALKTMAAASHRSMQEQIRLILEREARINRNSLIAEAGARRERLKVRALQNTVTDV